VRTPVRPVHVFSDFDGTISQPDTLSVITARLGDGAETYRANTRLLMEGGATLREVLEREMAAIRVPFAEAAALLRATVTVDPGFVPFARWCRERGIALTVLSAGFHEIIDLFLSPAELPEVEVLANRFEPGTWRCIFRDETPHGHDKARAVLAARKAGGRTVYVGDGVSDHEAAAAADLVFAKGRLVEFCGTRGIRHHTYESFDDVMADMHAVLEEEGAT
jgi:2-hydroxy-3-keto-5-methylthiopentenyl-1-phosphate phosphatase